MSASYPVDMHLHSSYSDGLWSPVKLADQAFKQNLSLIALCDHDTMEGLKSMEEALEKKRREWDRPAPRLIPAIELSTGTEGRTHLLGYGLDLGDPKLRAFLEDARGKRRLRVQRIVDQLERLPLELPEPITATLRQTATGRAHIARALVEAKVVNTVQQAFDRYLAEGRPAYVPREAISTTEGVALIQEAGGVPVLAHPKRLNMDEPAFQALCQHLIGAGLQGLECFHPSASRKTAKALEAYARGQSLLVTGGSDFHGDQNTRSAIAHMPSGWQNCLEDAKALLERTALA